MPTANKEPKNASLSLWSKALAKVIAKERRLLSLTQAQLSKKLGYSSEQYIGIIEKGYWCLRLDSLSKIAKVFNIPVSRLILLAELEYKKLEAEA